MEKVIMNCCDLLTIFTNGDTVLNGAVNLIYFSNVRLYALLDNHVFHDDNFEPIDYCPFCGFKFPRRLDEELTKILQTEYGLESWKDYKKAPEEFHSDKWWKERDYDYIEK
ncbi:MAG: hypothetical protein LBS71_03025 [Puniceicoccales bacterium]|jgi:hypothetical protein|nr:hypothetical protein [Puniceicoccales bacterium]